MVYDVALGIFLKHLIDAAEASDEAQAAWLSTAISEWREVACIGDIDLTLDEGWSPIQRRSFIALVEDACARLAARRSIPAEEIMRWPLLNDLRIHSRGATEVLTAPVVELGRGVIGLISGTLPNPPTGKTWLYGTGEGRVTLDMRLSWVLQEESPSSNTVTEAGINGSGLMDQPLTRFSRPAFSRFRQIRFG